MTDADSVQLSLVQVVPPSGDSKAGARAGPTHGEPVALVVIDTSLAHLDRGFEYAVPADMSDTALRGVRVRVRFAGRDHDGFVLERRAVAQHHGALTPLGRVVSPEPVLTEHIHRVARRIADHYAGSLSDVLRLAIPPRHARAESEVGQCHPVGQSTALPDIDLHAAAQAWADYPAGAALLARLAQGESPFASVLALPGRGHSSDAAAGLAATAAAARASGRGAVIVVSDARDVARVSAALDRLLGPGQHVQLSADQGPSARYAAWLSLLRGHHAVVVGTRAAAYAPVRNPGVFALWDDADDAHREPRSPYPHVREVLRARAADAGAGLVISGFVRTAEVAYGVDQGWIRRVDATSAAVRASAAAVSIAGEGHEAARDAAAATARLPSSAWRAVATGVKVGPVLIQVPRRGYVMGLSCASCRARIRCPACQGPTEVPGDDVPARCRWCATEVADRACAECGSTRRRGAVTGEQRTAYEIGRAFPGVNVVTSRAGQVQAEVGEEPAIVVATPGAEPVARGGYAAVVLLDGWSVVGRSGLDSPVQALHRWCVAAALARPREAGGVIVVCGVPAHAGVRPVEALLRWDPQWLIEAELRERAETGLPPFARLAAVSGPAAAVGEEAVHLSAQYGCDFSLVDVMGPVPEGGDRARLVLRTVAGAGPQAGAELLRVVRAIRGRRSAGSATERLHTVVDPADIGT